MTTNGTHIVRQQYLDVTFHGGEKEGIAFQQQLASSCTQDLMPVLEEVLEKFAPVDGHLLIDRLDIDLGDIQLEEADARLSDIFKKHLETAIQDTIRRHAGLTTTGIPGNSPVQWMDHEVAAQDAFLYFLSTGRLPWHFRLAAGTTLEKWIKSILEQHSESPGWTTALRYTLQQPIARERLSKQFFIDFLWFFIQKTDPDHAAVAGELLQIFPEDRFPVLQQHIIAAWFEQWATGALPATRAALLGTAIKWMLYRPSAQSTGVFQQLQQGHHPIPPDLMAVINTNAHAQPDSAVRPDEQSPYPNAETEGWYIENAGLVLLHPFLTMLLEGTGMAAENTITDPDKALQLLHYLCTGVAAAPEYELTLSKVLCGVALDIPTDANIRLLPEDMEEADALLQAAIRYWGALQNTSADGLRGTFLLRPGKLSVRPDGDWELQVEHRSVDILLDQLPWSYSMIKLPWMNTFLHVEWT